LKPDDPTLTPPDAPAADKPRGPRVAGFPEPLARLPEEWITAAAKIGARPFQAKQIFKWIQTKNVFDPAKMTDLALPMREKLAASETAFDVLEVSEVHRSSDHTRKALVRFADGKTVETVLIPGVSGARKVSLEEAFDLDPDSPDTDDEDDDEPNAATAPSTKRRVTQCISTQVGCAMACVFCASGVAGLQRQLRADEIVAQVLHGRLLLDADEELRNVVYMGMGEPLHNYAETARSLRLLTHRDGIGLSSRRVTVSTSGLVPEIAKLGADFGGQIGLAISLHAADDETRTRLMPINKKYPLAVLIQALREYPLPKRRRITIEYTLVAGRNDQLDEAKKLAKLLRGLPVKVNLIPMNPIEASTLGPPDFSGVLRFQRVLHDAGYSCFVRKRRGDDVAAACGQLAILGAKKKVRVDRT
jgi:23S rRNA (adenine2503-C2)-methyltransferase